MAAIPESTCSSVALRLLDHAEQNWPQLHRVQVTSRAGFAYVTGILPDGEQIPPATCESVGFVRAVGGVALIGAGDAGPLARAGDAGDL